MRIVTAEKNLVQLGLVELVPLVPNAKFTVGGAQQNTLRFGNAAGQSGFQEQVEGTLRLPTEPTAGTPIFQIKYNNKIVHTVKSE